MAVPGRLLDKSWTLPDRFRYQNYCKKQYETHFPRHAFRIDFYMVFVTFLHLLDGSRQLLGGSCTAVGRLWESSGRFWRLLGASGRLLGGSWAALGRLLGGSWWLLGGSWASLCFLIKNLLNTSKNQQKTTSKNRGLDLRLSTKSCFE